MPVTEEWLNQQAQILLGKAEELYLPRDKAFRFDGVKAGDAGPFVRFHLDGIGVGFELDRKALDHQHLAHYQVAHEVNGNDRKLATRRQRSRAQFAFLMR